MDGLPLKRTNALGHTFAYAYDKARRLTVLTNENGETYRLDYDQTDNLIQETGWDGKITAYGYDAAGQLVQQTEYGQSNNEGRLKERPETWHIHSFKRNILGQLIEKQSRKVSGRNGQSKDEGISRTRFDYDPITGNLTKARNQHSSVELAYDELDRLIGETTVHNGQSATVGYQYDPLGNRIRTILPDDRHIDYLYYGSGHLHQRGEGKTTAPISDDPKTQDRLKSPAHPNLVSGNRLKEYNGIEYTYDALGNLIYRQLPNGENQYYQYDLENQLVRAEIKKPAGNTEIWTYAYDPFGRRLSKERQDKLAWTSTDPKRTHFVWDGSRLLQEYTYKGSYTYIYTDQDSYEPLAQIFDNAKDGKQYLAYFHNDQIGIPREMTDIHGNLLWYGEYTAWGRLKKDGRIYKNAHQPFRLQNQYFDEETGLHYNLMRYYEPEAGRFVNQDPIGLLGGENLYWFAPNAQRWVDTLGLSPSRILDRALGGKKGDRLSAHHLIPVEIWAEKKDFLDRIGLQGHRDRASNGLLIPGSRAAYLDGVGKGMRVYHSSSHPNYSDMVRQRLDAIERSQMSDKEKKKAVRKLQIELRRRIWAGNVPQVTTCNSQKNRMN